MKKFLSLLLVIIVFGGNLFAQQIPTVQGFPRNDIHPSAQKPLRTTKNDTSFDMEDIQFWVGEGANKAALVIEWHDDKSPDALVWGYKWDGDAYGIDMITAIVKEDPRLIFLTHNTGSMGNMVAGLGYNLNGTDTHYLIYDKDADNPMYPVQNIVYTNAYNYDNWTYADSQAHWASGWTSGYWSYLVKNSADATWGYSQSGASGRKLKDGSWDGWSYSDLSGMGGNKFGSKFTAAPKPAIEAVDYTNGIFFVNEDWFGHTNGSVNFMKSDGEMVYRAYTRENPGETFGAITQFGTIYGDNFYFVSKQASDGNDPIPGGGRLVVADAVTLKKKAAFEHIGGGDGRSFLGVDEYTGYIGASNGIFMFDTETLTVGDLIAETGGGSAYAGQIGTMLRIGDYVFACKQNKGILVIDANTHKYKATIECENIGTIVQSFDGNLWASAYSDGLWKINPYTFEIEEKVTIPVKALIPGSWGAWTSSLMCASKHTNTLYWAKMGGSSMTFFGTEVYRYEIGNNGSLDAPFYTLTGAEGKEAFYGSGINIDPVTDNLVITSTKSGYGANYQKNWVRIVDGTSGELISVKELDAYYWFPAMSVFPDKYAPVVSNLGDVEVVEGGSLSIYLGDKVSDEDNLDAAIVKSIVSVSNKDLLSASIYNDTLIVAHNQAYNNSFKTETIGSCDIVIKFNSNGKVVFETITAYIVKDGKSIQHESNGVYIYPTLTDGIIHVSVDGILPIKVIDISGAIMQQFTSSDNDFEIDLGSYKQGIYFIVAGDKVTKVIKK